MLQTDDSYEVNRAATRQLTLCIGNQTDGNFQTAKYKKMTLRLQI